MSNIGRSANIARQRRIWTRRVDSWDHADSPGLDNVVDAVLASVPEPDLHTVVDVGAGTGRLTFPLARRAKSVIAVDISAAMCDRLMERAREAGLDNVRTRVGAAEHLEFDLGSVDAVVSNYALHHLRDPDKQTLVHTTYKWLKPGGHLVVGDMMFGRGTTARDREIIASKALAMIRKGPAGWLRVAKNAGRFLFRVQERPVSPEAWVKMFERAGFVDVTVTPVVAEAAVVRGRRPGAASAG